MELIMAKIAIINFQVRYEVTKRSQIHDFIEKNYYRLVTFLNLINYLLAQSIKSLQFSDIDFKLKTAALQFVKLK